MKNFILPVILVIHYILGFLSFGGTTIATVFILVHISGIRVVFFLSLVLEFFVLYKLLKKAKPYRYVYGFAKLFIGAIVLWSLIVSIDKFNIDQKAISIMYIFTCFLLAVLIILNSSFSFSKRNLNEKIRSK
jgi:hypothetical protein